MAWQSFAVIFIWEEFLDSFMWGIVWLIFGNVFGISQIYLWRWSYAPDFGIVGNENSTGFGQIVALLLLLLPLLAAVEVYTDTLSRTSFLAYLMKGGQKFKMMVLHRLGEKDELEVNLYLLPCHDTIQYRGRKPALNPSRMWIFMTGKVAASPCSWLSVLAWAL